MLCIYIRLFFKLFFMYQVLTYILIFCLYDNKITWYSSSVFTMTLYEKLGRDCFSFSATSLAWPKSGHLGMPAMQYVNMIKILCSTDVCFWSINTNTNKTILTKYYYFVTYLLLSKTNVTKYCVFSTDT